MIGSRPSRSAAGAYRAVEGIGAEPEDFMKMALDAARLQLLRAEAAIGANQRVEKAHALSSAASIVEFMLGLSGSAPGTLSKCLVSVYQYVLAAILKGNVGDDREAVGAARVALDELAATWRKLFPDTDGAEDHGFDSALSAGRDHA